MLCAIAMPLTIAAEAAPYGRESAAAAMEEIVVAGLRETALADVPASVTALDRQDIQAFAVQHFEELTRLVPNLNWSGEGSRARYFQLRGIGELEQYEGAPNPSVGFIIDDIDFSGIGSAATLFDTERVEVLRGPQGTRFGANALAGLVYMRTAEPTPELSALVEATGGDDDTRALGGSLGGPLIGNTLGYRVTLQKYESDGFRDNKFIGSDNTYKRDELTGRVKLRWQPTADWRADLTGVYLDVDNGYDAFAIDNDYDTFSDKPGQDAQETAAGSLRVTGELSSAVTLTSITSAALSDITFSFDADWGNDDFWARDRFGNSVYDYFSSTERDRDTYTQELRLASGPDGRLFGDRADWLVGVYWQRLEEDNDIENFARDDFTPPCFAPYVTLQPGPPARCRQDFASDYEADSYAVFGQLDIALGARTTLGIGLRAERRETDYRDSNGADFDPDDDMWGGELTLTRELSDRFSGYARLARGYRAGGFNVNPAVPAAEQQFDKEHLWNYEVGLRGAAVNGRWNADLTLFWQERRDMQVRIPLQDAQGDPILFTFFTDNAEEGRNRGIEFQGALAMTDTITLRGMLGLLDTEVSSFDYDPTLEDRDQAHAPEYSFAVGASWQSSGGWFADVDLSGKDSFYFDFSHDEQSDSYEIVSLRAGREWGNWSVSGWVRNATDEDYAVRGFFFANEPPNFDQNRLYKRLGDPRHIGITVRYTLN
jgi:outer membrane receptor protein involved in Fe transport